VARAKYLFAQFGVLSRKEKKMFCLRTSGVEPVFGDARSVGDHLVTVYEQTTSAPDKTVET